MAREIPLSKGLVAIVDDEDYDLVTQVRWHAHVKRYTAYARRSAKIDGVVRKVWMHRLILPPPPGMVIDHINHNGLDNRRCNLRICTHSENLLNVRPGIVRVYHRLGFGKRGGAGPPFIDDDRPRRGRRRLYHEIYFDKSRGSYRARALIGAKLVYVGAYATRDDAQAALAKFLEVAA